MKKLICFLVFLFLMPVALAEDAAPYVPGAATKALFAEAFERGDMLLASMGVDVAFSENAADIFEEDAELLGALSEALKNATLTGGIGQIEDGVRVLLAGQYEKDEQTAELSLTLDLTAQGASLMSSVLPGERVSASWETLLTLCGMSPEEAAQILSLRDADVQALLNQFLEEAQAMMAVVGQIAAPYGETILTHIAALPIQVLEDVPAEAGYPAAATEISLTISSKALGDLLIALADQLEADSTMCAIIDMALAESGEEITAAQLCQAIRAAASESLTDESHPVFVYIGQGENGELLYFNMVRRDEQDVTAVLSLVNKPNEEMPDAAMLTLDALTLSPENAIVDGISLIATYPQAAQNGTDVQVVLDMYVEGENLLTTEFALTEGAVTTEDALRGRAAVCSLLLAACDDEDVVSLMLTTDSLQSETADGGEQATVSGSLDISADDMQLPMSFEVYSLTEKTQSGPVSTMTNFLRMPQLGIAEYIESYAFYTAAYEPDLSAMTNLALETASSEELEALAGRAMTALQETLTTLQGMLPEVLTAVDAE